MHVPQYPIAGVANVELSVSLPLPSNRHHRINGDWRVRGKIILSVLCNIVRNNCAQCNAHTHEQT